MQDKLEQALATLRAPALVALRHRPAMVATLVALCEKRGTPSSERRSRGAP
jgi:hypothetical protein